MDNFGDYISREAALSEQNKSMNLAEMRERLKRIPAADVRSTEYCEECRDALLKTIDHYKQLCADVRPVARAAWQSWEQDKPPCKWYSCDYCGFHALSKSNYCPNCGADMREES